MVSLLVHRRRDPVNPRARSTPIRCVATPRNTSGIPRRGALRLGALRTRSLDRFSTAVH